MVGATSAPGMRVVFAEEIVCRKKSAIRAPKNRSRRIPSSNSRPLERSGTCDRKPITVSKPTKAMGV